MPIFSRPARHLPARALQWQAGRSRSGEAGGSATEVVLTVMAMATTPELAFFRLKQYTHSI